MKPLIYLLLGSPLWALAQFNGSTTTAGTISREGNVGIGVDNPSAKLELFNPNCLGGLYGSSLKLFSTGGAVGNRIVQSIWLLRGAQSADASYTSGWTDVWLHDGISVDASFTRPGGTTRTWWGRQPADDIQAWGTGPSTYMMLKAGALAVGTAFPEGRFEVWNGEDKPSLIARQMSTVPGGYCMVANVNASTTKALVVTNNNYGGIASNWKEFFVVHGSGLVQMGLKKTNPWGPQHDAIVSVDGKLMARSIVVTIDPDAWADYVFEGNYRLRPLAEVEKYYRRYKHLPGICSAAEIGEKGIDVAAMDAKLLEKIEELTLYTVALKKELEALKQELKDLKASKSNR